MKTFVVIATGQSLTQEDVDYVQGKAHVIVISDAHKMAPWADYLVSADANWWKYHPEAYEFKGYKYSRNGINNAVKKFSLPGIVTSCNSGLLGMYLADHLQADRIILLGFDMHGTHFFGRHKEPLVNTTDHRFKEHIKQFERWRGTKVINCTPGSALQKFPFRLLREVL